MHRITTRKNLNRLPSLPLPFHVRSVGFNRADPGWRETYPGRMKNFVQLFWTVHGEGKFILNDRTIHAGAGDVFYRLPGEKHEEHNAGSSEWYYFWVTFDGPGAAPFLESFGYSRNGIHGGACPLPLFLELEKLIPLDNDTAQRKALAICVEILTLAGGDGTDPQQIYDPLARALEIIRRDRNSAALNVDSLAKEMALHRSTLTRLFQKKLGRTPGDVIREQRLACALELLNNTVMPMKEAAFAAGFNDPAYFCRWIRQQTGMTPEQVRKKNWKKRSKRHT